MRSLLIVRLGALGDLVHALPVAAALRRAFPDARIDWLAKLSHRAFLDLVPVIDRRVFLRGSGLSARGPGGGSRGIGNQEPGFGGQGSGIGSPGFGIRKPASRGTGSPGVAQGFSPVSIQGGLLATIRTLRQAHYDAAIDLQGLGKSAVLARLSGARQVIGFPRGQLRESWARAFYTHVCDPRGTVHVIEKNLSALAVLGVTRGRPEFPLEVPPSSIVEAVRALLPPGASDYALLNAGGGWPNKCWPAERFGAVASALRDRHGLPSVVLAGPGEASLARAVVDASSGAAFAAPPTTIGDLLALAGSACLVVSGDTGPLHLAAAVGAPIVGIFGPTSPARNGPWHPADRSVSRFETCVCHHKRRCERRAGPCLLEIGVEEVLEAIAARLEGQGAHR